MKEILVIIIKLNRLIRDSAETGYGVDDRLFEMLDDITDYFLDELGFPKDTTVETANEDGTLNFDNPNYFCRDYLSNKIWDWYSLSDVSDLYEWVIKELKSL